MVEYKSLILMDGHVPKQFISLAMMEMKLEGTKEFPSGETRTQNRRRGKSMRHG
jgi:hypothetical protein